jgi:nucleotide-binding universal stress UspA family protein
MKTLVPIDGSRSALEAALYAARTRPAEELELLYVSPSGRPAELARGRFLLESSRKSCQEIAAAANIRTRLVVGDPKVKLSEAASDPGCDLVVLGAYDMNARPHVDPSGVPELAARPAQRVVVVLPSGRELEPGIELRHAA